MVFHKKYRCRHTRQQVTRWRDKTSKIITMCCVDFYLIVIAFIVSLWVKMLSFALFIFFVGIEITENKKVFYIIVELFDYDKLIVVSIKIQVTQYCLIPLKPLSCQTIFSEPNSIWTRSVYSIHFFVFCEFSQHHITYSASFLRLIFSTNSIDDQNIYEVIYNGENSRHLNRTKNQHIIISSNQPKLKLNQNKKSLISFQCEIKMTAKKKCSLRNRVKLTTMARAYQTNREKKETTHKNYVHCGTEQSV